MTGSTGKKLQTVDTEAPDSEAIMHLIEKCIKGDVLSQRRLFEQYGPLVKGVIIRYITDAETVKDLLNSIFFKIFEKLHTYTPSAPFGAWARRVAVNAVIDHQRRNKKFQNTHNTDFTDKEIGIADEVSARLSYKELLAIIQNIPEMQRTVFNLFVFEDLSHKEISVLLAISEPNSRWYLNDARKRLKEKILKTDL